MSKFIESAASRETSVELMEAILEVAGGDEAIAEQIWEDGARDEELVAIIEIVTKNGVHETTDFCWGAAGTDWAA
ncbi:YccJ family protein [Alcanivoracaceae bacterium MT1]